MRLTEEHLRAMVHGGAVLGGGGGGSLQSGLTAGRQALAAGAPHLITLDDLPDDATLVTLSGVGTVRGAGGVDELEHDSRALQRFLSTYDHPIAGLIPSEVGALAVAYGWHESATVGLPVVDAPCNGRAHPLGLMGSLGLHRQPGHTTTTVAVGGRPGDEHSVALTIQANAAHCTQIVRGTVAQVGVALAVVRNPLPVSYVRQHAAVGGLGDAWRVGETLLRHLSEGLPAVLRALSREMGGRELARGTIHSIDLSNRSGLTVGSIEIRGQSGEPLRILVCNEYMIVLREEQPLAVFPDLITLFDAATALPLNTADVQPDQRVGLFMAPRDRLKLASTMADRELLQPVEELLQIRFPDTEGA